MYRSTTNIKMYVGPLIHAPAARLTVELPPAEPTADDAIPAVPAAPPAIVRERIQHNDPAARRRVFWKLVDEFAWTNHSEGECNRRKYDQTVRHWNNIDWAVFEEFYTAIGRQHLETLMQAGIFGADRDHIAGIISHVILLGEIQSQVLFDDIHFLTDVAMAGEIQPINHYLPEGIRI